MKVAVTGGTGFVGSHTVAALARAGHEVRLLVRSPEKVARALEPHGIETPDTMLGDVTDPGSIDGLLDGMDALIHGANMFTFDVRQNDEMKRINEEGTELVLIRAAKRGLDPIIHVSSTVAFLPAGQPSLRTHRPVTPLRPMRRRKPKRIGSPAGCRARERPWS